MSKNPYEPSHTTDSGRNRSSFRYFIAAGLLFAIAFAISSPGIAQLNRQPLPGRYATYDPEFFLFGRAVSEQTFMNWSVGLGAILFFAAIATLFVGFHARRSARR